MRRNDDIQICKWIILFTHFNLKILRMKIAENAISTMTDLKKQRTCIIHTNT